MISSDISTKANSVCENPVRVSINEDSHVESSKSDTQMPLGKIAVCLAGCAFVGYSLLCQLPDSRRRLCGQKQKIRAHNLWWVERWIGNDDYPKIYLMDKNYKEEYAEDLRTGGYQHQTPHDTQKIFEFTPEARIYWGIQKDEHSGRADDFFVSKSIADGNPIDVDKLKPFIEYSKRDGNRWHINLKTGVDENVFCQTLGTTYKTEMLNYYHQNMYKGLERSLYEKKLIYRNKPTGLAADILSSKIRGWSVEEIKDFIGENMGFQGNKAYCVVQATQMTFKATVGNITQQKGKKGDEKHVITLTNIEPAGDYKQNLKWGAYLKRNRKKDKWVIFYETQRTRNNAALWYRKPE